MIKGIPASKGIGIGKALVYKEPDNFSQFIGRKISDYEVENEVRRFDEALLIARGHIEDTKVKASKVLEVKELQVFDAYKMVLNDPIFKDMVLSNIKRQFLGVEASVLEAVDKIRAMFLAVNNEYMKQRAEDMDHVGKYVLEALLGIERIDLSILHEDTILIAKDLSPADTVSLDKNHIKGFAIEKGGGTSHTAIVARTLEIPAVVGCGEKIMGISTGCTIILDGEKGIVILNPEQELIDEYKDKIRLNSETVEELKLLKSKPAETKDGRIVELCGNIAKPQDALAILEKGGDGVGLFRTEFLYLDRSQLPTEDEQFIAYKKVTEVMGNMPCIIRTMDIGGDKQLKSLSIPDEENPFLGYRAIRICLKEVDLFKTQLRAILRASAYGKLKVMFPMISGLEELRAAKNILNEVKLDLDEKGILYDKNIKVGVMIEIPSAAVIADLLAKEADFFSIGTNDLCQYTLAVDRMNENISYLYNPLHIGVLRLIKNVIDEGHRAGITVGMCGEMASNVENAVILLGLGLDEFSMAPSSIPQIKSMIRNITFDKARDIAKNVMKMENPREITDYVKERLYAD